MDMFDWEELTAEMLNISDEQREDNVYLDKVFHDRFCIELEDGFELAKALLLHTVPIEGGLSKERYHAFVSLKTPTMLMKSKAN